MKNIVFLFILFPVFLSAQKKIVSKPKAKAVTVKKATGYSITGNIKGLADGTKVMFLNGQSGAQESESIIKQGKFSFNGSMPYPDFKLIQIATQNNYIPLFLDNSNVKIIGKKDSLDKVKVTGSPSHRDYESFLKQIDPYKTIFSENAQVDFRTVQKAIAVCESFARKNSKSYIAPLAIIRYNQIAGEENKTEELFNLLPSEIKITPMGNYLAGQIAEMNKNAIGTVAPDFTQEDTAGKPFSLSALRGKYVLIDFWASWCRPCREENPNVVAAYNAFKDKNFTVLGVSLDKAKPSWIDAIKMDGLAWNHVSDLKAWSNAVAMQYGISSIPQNILVDKEGKIIGKNLRGPALMSKLSRVIQ